MKAINNLSHSVAILMTGTTRDIDESKAGAKIRWYWSHGHASCEGSIMGCGANYHSLIFDAFLPLQKHLFRKPMHYTARPTAGVAD